MSDTSPDAPEVHLLKRGNQKTPGDVVEPAFPAFLRTSAGTTEKFQPAKTSTTTGRRLAWANWLTEPGSAQASLFARVTVNRVWQQYFSIGIADELAQLGCRSTKCCVPPISGKASVIAGLLRW
jgi:hypothetical protein